MFTELVSTIERLNKQTKENEMRKIAMLIVLACGIASAYCEFGYKHNQEGVQGGYYVTYSFNNGKTIGVKYTYSDIIPYSIRFDFNSMEICR